MVLKKWWLPISICLLTIITISSLIPVPAGPEGSDKLMHLLCYAGLIFPAAYAANKRPIYFALFFLLWSGGIELIQPLVNRSGEWLDLFANGLGLVLGLALGFVARGKLNL